MPASAANLYFTAINDSVPPLTSDTMPFWSDEGRVVQHHVSALDPDQIALGDIGELVVAVFQIEEGTHHIQGEVGPAVAHN